MRFKQWLEATVSTDTLNDQIFNTVSHLLDGHWTMERQERASLLQFGGVFMVGQDVVRKGDQYCIGVRWQLRDSKGNYSGLYNQEKPDVYDSVKGHPQVSMYFGIQGYKPGDRGALGGIIRVKDRPMTPIQVAGGHVVDVKTPYEVAVKARKIIEDYDADFGPDDGDDEAPEPDVPVGPHQLVGV